MVSGDQSVKEMINYNTSIWGLKITFSKEHLSSPNVLLIGNNGLKLSSADFFITPLEEIQLTDNLLLRDLRGI